MQRERIEEKRREEKSVNKSGGRKVGSIPGRIGRNSRVVALRRMSGNIAGRRLWGFNIRAHVHGDPRAAKHHHPINQCFVNRFESWRGFFLTRVPFVKTNNNNKPNNNNTLLFDEKKRKKKNKEKEKGRKNEKN